MPEIDVAIELRIPDNTAFTVLTALRDLGYRDLQHVERLDRIVLTVTPDADPDDVMRKLARAEVLFNPNKHRLSCALQAAMLVEPPQFEAYVRDKDEDAARLLRLLVTTFGIGSARGLERSTGWRLFEAAGPASAQRMQWACTALLSNPVSQTFAIERRPVRQLVGEPPPVAAKGTQ